MAHARGDFAAAERAWLRAGEGRPVESGAFLAVAVLAAGYGGDRDRAAELLAQAQRRSDLTGVTPHLAFAAYVEGELHATTDPTTAIPYYERAVELARRVGATFPEGVADVALASARTRTWDVTGAAAGFAHLLESWRRTGQETQLWTTTRNAAGLLASLGERDTTPLLLLCADAAPGTAVVDRRSRAAAGGSTSRSPSWSTRGGWRSYGSRRRPWGPRVCWTARPLRSGPTSTPVSEPGIRAP